MDINKGQFVDIITSDGQFIIHKQVEHRDGLRFVRLKKRRIFNEHH